MTEPISCWPCRDRGWQSVEGKHRPCPMCRPLNPERHRVDYGGAGSLTTVVASNGTPAAVSQAAGEVIVSMMKARIEEEDG